MQFTMKWITVWNGHSQLMFAFSDLGRPKVLSFSERRVNLDSVSLNRMYDELV